MSKRAGTFVTLREVVDEVGKDVFRFIMLTRDERPGARFRFRQGDRAVEGQSGLLRAIRPCPRRLGDAPRARRIHLARACAPARWRKPPLELADRSRRDRADPPAGAMAAPRRGRRRRRTSRTASPFICRKSRPRSTCCGTRARTRRRCASSRATRCRADPGAARAGAAVAFVDRLGPGGVRRRAGGGDCADAVRVSTCDDDERARWRTTSRDAEQAHRAPLRDRAAGARGCGAGRRLVGGQGISSRRRSPHDGAALCRRNPSR